jgi:uncharacterized membrane protein
MRRLLYGWVALIGAWIFSLVMYGRLPERIATHWNFRFEADGSSDRFWVALVVPTIVVIAAPLIAVVSSRIDPRRAARASDDVTYWTMWSLVLGLLAAVQVFIIANGAGWNITPSRVLPTLLGVFFVVFGNLEPRLRPNWFVGTRTPWTLSDDDVWRRSHRIGGYLTVAAGALLVVGAWLPTDALRFTVWAVALLLFAAPIAYSYVVWRRMARARPSASNS